MTILSPVGTARARFLGERAAWCGADDATAGGDDQDDFEAMYLGWEIARCAPGLAPDESRAIALLAAACLVAVRGGSTRLPLDDARRRRDAFEAPATRKADGRRVRTPHESLGMLALRTLDSMGWHGLIEECHHVEPRTPRVEGGGGGKRIERHPLEQFMKEDARASRTA